MDRSEVNDLFLHKIQPLALSSIASVCMTDSDTVSAVVREIVASIGALAREGKSLRLNMKVGYLLVQN